MLRNPKMRSRGVSGLGKGTPKEIDPRWKPAMDKLGLYAAFCAMCGCRENVHNEAHPFMHKDDAVHRTYPDPREALTFVRIVHAITRLGYRVWFHPQWVSIHDKHDTNLAATPGLYESVMKAFGENPDDHSPRNT